jgi:hypothetical protein
MYNPSCLSQTAFTWTSLTVTSPPLCFSFPISFAAIRRNTSKPLHVHLMVSDPAALVDPYLQTGADIISVHVETETASEALKKLPKLAAELVAHSCWKVPLISSAFTAACRGHSRARNPRRNQRCRSRTRSLRAAPGQTPGPTASCRYRVRAEDHQRAFSYSRDFGCRICLRDRTTTTFRSKDA